MSEQATAAEPTSVSPVTLTVKVSLQALAVPDESGGYSIVVPALRGCFSDADTIEEAQANAVEAAEGWLSAMHDRYADEALRAGTEPLPTEGSGA